MAQRSNQRIIISRTKTLIKPAITQNTQKKGPNGVQFSTQSQPIWAMQSRVCCQFRSAYSHAVVHPEIARCWLSEHGQPASAKRDGFISHYHTNIHTHEHLWGHISWIIPVHWYKYHYLHQRFPL